MRQVFEAENCVTWTGKGYTPNEDLIMGKKRIFNSQKEVTLTGGLVYLNEELLAQLAYRFFDDDGYEYYTDIFTMAKRIDKISNL